MPIAITNEQKETLAECDRILAGEKTVDLRGVLGKGCTSRYIETIWVASHLRKGCSVLDIGFSLSSLDTLGMFLSAKDTHGVTLSAVDIVSPEKVQTRYPDDWRKSIFEVPVVIGDVRTAKLPKETYDMVTCVSTIEHIGYDAPSITIEGSAFERARNAEDARRERDPNVNRDVLNAFHSTLKQGGEVLISVPMGKGGPILLQDSLGLYCVEWEYEESTWGELVKDPRFEVTEDIFFKNTPDGWMRVASPADLSDVTETIDAKGAGLALCVLAKK